MFRISVLILSLCTLFVLISACEDNPVSSEGEHANAVGFALEIEGDELFRYQARKATPNTDDFPDYFTENEDGDMILTLSEEVLDDQNRTDEIKLRWLDSDGEKFDLPPAYQDGDRTEDEWELRFSVAPEDGPISYEINKQDTGWSFWLYAEDSGEVDFEVILWHIDHADLLQTIPVRSDI